MSKEQDRVVCKETREFDAGIEQRQFRNVEIRYSNGDPFYSGWIQVFEDSRTGPTFFEENYETYSLEREVVSRREKYWQPVAVNSENVELRLATLEDVDELIDLNFQNYFDGGQNRISAYQGLFHLDDNAYESLVFTVDKQIFAFLCFKLGSPASPEDAYFESLFVAPCARNMGVGSALIAAGLDKLREKGAKKVSGRIIGGEEHCEQIGQMLSKQGFNIENFTPYSPRWIEVDMSVAL